MPVSGGWSPGDERLRTGEGEEASKLQSFQTEQMSEQTGDVIIPSKKHTLSAFSKPCIKEG